MTEATAKDFERSYRRVARLGDGWMTTAKTPEQVREGVQMIQGYAKELGRVLDEKFEVCVYYNINVNQDRDKAFAESKKFLDDYYTVDYHRDFLEMWVAMGSPRECADSIRAFLDAVATTITLRPTGYDQCRQFKRITDEVFPLLV
jgi:alkanesulfonate monooxygenase SsuD/methylene tetrahydromethanopterin reductase-like flavin-dependent oxidoreductase (luciferase family)